MADLLRRIFPGLVPVVGGADFGMDGAIPDGAGEPYPLVCTIRRDVIGNLTRSLDSFVGAGGRSRKVVVATSQSLTPRKQNNLRDRAREKGFVLEQIFDRHAVANLLAENSRWRRDLLGIPAPPGALTEEPRTRRPFYDLSPVGRAHDLAWLRSTQGDRVLVGQPGAGKTFLPLHLMRREGWNARFLDPAASRAEVADDYGDLRPDIVIVDDAHVYREKLEDLVHLRRSQGASFAIVATTWPTGRDGVLEALGGQRRSASWSC